MNILRNIFSKWVAIVPSTARMIAFNGELCVFSLCKALSQTILGNQNTIKRCLAATKHVDAALSGQTVSHVWTNKMLYNVWSNFWRQILSNTIQHDQAVQKENVWSLNSVWSLLVAKQFTFARLRKVENLWIGGVKICELSLKRSYLEQVAIFRHLPFCHVENQNR